MNKLKIVNNQREKVLNKRASLSQTKHQGTQKYTSNLSQNKQKAATKAVNYTPFSGAKILQSNYFVI